MFFGDYYLTKRVEKNELNNVAVFLALNNFNTYWNKLILKDGQMIPDNGKPDLFREKEYFQSFPLYFGDIEEISHDGS